MDETSEEFKSIHVQYQTVKSIAANKATLVARFQLATIVLSVLTSGSLWLSLSKVFPDLTLWLGAVASTLIAGITLYMQTTGISQIRTDGLSLERDIGDYLAGIREAANPPADFWNKHKEFASRLDQLRYGQHGQPS